MTSVSVLYFKEIDCDMATPPDSLIELFTEWISENPNLCSETQPPLVLLSGAIPMPLIPPIEGLIRWCTLSPLFLPLNDLIYSKLHYAVLQSLTQVRNNTNRHILPKLKNFIFIFDLRQIKIMQHQQMRLHWAQSLIRFEIKQIDIVCRTLIQIQMNECRFVWNDLHSLFNWALCHESLLEVYHSYYNDCKHYQKMHY